MALQRLCKSTDDIASDLGLRTKEGSLLCSPRNWELGSPLQFSNKVGELNS